MDRKEQAEPKDVGQKDLSQSDFRSADQGTGTSESHTGQPWEPAVGEAAGDDHPQTTQAEPTDEPDPAKPRHDEPATAAPARNDSESGGR